jgi:hypothetical protein
MKFPKFPAVEGYPCSDPDLFWGYACAGHVPLNEFRERCCELFGVPNEKVPFPNKSRWPRFAAHDSLPCHAFVSPGGRTWHFCFPDSRRAKPISFWPGDSCSYCDWLMQMLKDICYGEGRKDREAIRLVHTLQLFAYESYRPALKSFVAAVG